VVVVSALSSKNWEYQIDLIRKEFKTRNVKVLYAPEEAWTLRAAGVTNPLDSNSYPSLQKKGITHILLIGESDVKKGNVYDYKTPDELAMERNPIPFLQCRDGGKCA
jgi:hypothetical protein